MQKIFNSILGSMFFSFSFCEDEEGFRFVNTSYDKSYMDLETINEFWITIFSCWYICHDFGII